MKNSRVAIDSNAVTYFLQAMETGREPIGDLAAEKISLLRTYFYRGQTYCISPTVKAECSLIPDDERRKYHLDLVDILLHEVANIDTQELDIRISEYAQFHTGPLRLKDCKIVAEAELGGCDYLLTFDDELLRNLKGRTHKINLLEPSTYWSCLDIQRGSKSTWEPHETNPLSKVSWWKWL